jgi:hypothetical protein
MEALKVSVGGGGIMHIWGIELQAQVFCLIHSNINNLVSSIVVIEPLHKMQLLSWITKFKCQTYLDQFDTNYIIFRNVKIFKNYFIRIKKYCEQ